MTALRAVSGSSAENLFISLFEDVFGAEKTGYLYSQYPFFDIYQDSRFADFLLENGGRRVAIEIDDDASHLPGNVSQLKHYDDLTKQNSMVHMGWAVYRWPVRIMQGQPERVEDELRIFLGSRPQFRAIADYLPTQCGRTFRLKEHQQKALNYLIIDEAHHAAAETYQKVLAYFTPRFTLGLTATPERADDQDMAICAIAECRIQEYSNSLRLRRHLDIVMLIRISGTIAEQRASSVGSQASARSALPRAY